MIKLKKISNRTQFKGAIWVVVGAENIRVHQVGNIWLADEYKNGEYVCNIAKGGRSKALLLQRLAAA